MSNKKKKIKIGITVGDLNGIGLEIILKTFKDIRILEFCTPIIFGSKQTMYAYQQAINISELNINYMKNLSEVKENRLNLINCWKENTKIVIGETIIESAKYAVLSLQEACSALKQNKIDVLVTAPINKAAIQKKIRDFIGHTEFLEENFEGNALMIMLSEAMKIAFVTGHIPLSEVKQKITEKKIISKTEQLHNILIQDFGIRKPKIAILGVNPHAGEDGMLGSEEKKIIVPAIKKLNENGIMAFGPYPADSFFSTKNLTAFDSILAMYHDQGLTPFKTISFFNGVNYTAGLNIIRTSPVHGTANSIFGKGEANEQSFREAIFAACNIYRKRAEFKELSSNHLTIKTRK